MSPAPLPKMGCKAIARAVRKAGIAGLYGLHGTENLSGDQVRRRWAAARGRGGRGRGTDKLHGLDDDDRRPAPVLQVKKLDVLSDEIFVNVLRVRESTRRPSLTPLRAW